MILYLLSEDSSAKARNVLKNVLVKALFILEERFDESKVSFPDTKTHDLVVNANNWKSKNPPAKFDTLCRFFSGIYLSSQPEFVFWHIDADISWTKEFNYEQSDNFILLRKRVLAKVRSFVEAKGHSFSEDSFFKKVIPVMPCYSIEAWLYQNHKQLKDKYPSEQVELIKLKSECLVEYDEIDKIKSKTTFTNKRNELLSERFPGKKIKELGMSFDYFLSEIDKNAMISSSIPKYDR